MNRDKRPKLYTSATLRDPDGNVTAEITMTEPVSVWQAVGMLQAEDPAKASSRNQ